MGKGKSKMTHGVLRNSKMLYFIWPLLFFHICFLISFSSFADEKIVYGPAPKNFVEAIYSQHATWKSLEEKTVGIIQITSDGHIVPSFDNDGSIHIVKEGETYNLIEKNSIGMPKISGSVSKDGTITFEKGVLDKDAPVTFPNKWPHKAFGGGLKKLKEDKVLFNTKEKLKAPKAPEGTISWLYINRFMNFVAPSPNTKPFPNILWVVKDGEGFKFVHSGPKYSGDYAAVGPDYKITYYNLPPEFIYLKPKNEVWGISDEREIPLSPKHRKSFFYTNFYGMGEYTIDDDGAVSIPAELIECEFP